MAQLTAHDFKAEVVSRDGDNLTYRVTGQVTCPTDGYSFGLEVDNEGIYRTGDSAALALKGSIRSGLTAEVLSEEPVEGTFIDSHKLEAVTINLGEVLTADDQRLIDLPLTD